MIGQRGEPLREAGLAILVAATGWSSFWAWTGFTERPWRFWLPLAGLALLIAASGAVLRATRLHPLLVVVGQVSVGAIATVLVITGSLPTPSAIDELLRSLRAAAETATGYAAPVPADAPGIHPLLITGGAATLVLADLLVGSFRQVAASGLVLLTVYAVPVSLLADGVGWYTFALPAAGYLLMLLWDRNDVYDRWGRVLGRAGPASTRWWRAAWGMGVATIAGASLAATVIPVLGLEVFEGGPGSGDDPVRIFNPMTDLRRDLQRGDDIALLTIRTEDPDPSYLRISVLNRFSGNEWSSGDRTIPAENRADGVLPPWVGVSRTVDGSTFDYQVSVTDDFQSRWLPTMASLNEIHAAGDWRYDPDSMDFLATDSDLSTAGLDYTMVATKLDLSGVDLNGPSSMPDRVPAEFTELPPELPPQIAALARTVTRDQASQFARAVTLQNWFRANFVYDLSVEPGNGSDDLLTFVETGPTGRRGYCEQFSAAMAVMARSLGIPARVAVGFLTPERTGSDQWTYSAWDLHAWPELYFPGAGWIRFEPTPGARATTVPSYTRVALPPAPTLPSTNPAAPSDDLPDRNTASPSASADSERTVSPARATSVAGQPVWPVLLGVLLLVAAGLAGWFAPAAVASWRRERRWRSAPTAETAWLDLRDAAVDLALDWPQGRSPRALGRWVGSRLGRPGDESARPERGPELWAPATEATDRLVLALERSRYAPDPEPVSATQLHRDVGVVIDSLFAGVPERVRQRARRWPRSLWRRQPAPLPVASDPRELDRVG